MSWQIICKNNSFLIVLWSKILHTENSLVISFDFIHGLRKFKPESSGSGCHFFYTNCVRECMRKRMLFQHKKHSQLIMAYSVQHMFAIHRIAQNNELQKTAVWFGFVVKKLRQLIRERKLFVCFISWHI